MECAEVRHLLRQRDDAEPSDRDAALEHLDHCRECAALAPGLDPVLLFRRLPALGVAPAETARMREAVAVLRRAPADAEPARRSGLVVRLAAALVGTAALLLAPGPAARGPAAVVSAVPATPAARLAGAVPPREYLPSVETLGESGAYVATQVTEDDLTLVILANVDVAGR